MKSKAFFGKKVPVGKIEVDRESTSAVSPEVMRRMERISDNYDKLNSVLAELESRIQKDPTLREYDRIAAEAAETGSEETGRRTKKKRSSRSRRRSAGPNKPR
ncbi:MAG: hypothetical protein AAF456_06335 [Planctomycetota bacterium]